jgi:hypothetical protein
MIMGWWDITRKVYKVKWKFLICMKVFRKPFQILPIIFHYIGDSVGKKINSQKIINYHYIDRGTIPMISKIYWWIHSIDIFVCN